MLLAAFFWGCSSGPDVVFITIDTLRVDHVGAFSSNSPAQTPNIDALAGDSVLFSSAYSPISVTGPAFATLHTGMDPKEHGVVINMFRGGIPLKSETVTLAELLLDKGYKTAAFVSGFTLHPQLNLDQGFEHYSFPPKKQARRLGKDTLAETLEWMSWQWMGNYFVWFHTYDPHGPWDVWATEEELDMQRSNNSGHNSASSSSVDSANTEHSINILGPKRSKESYIYTSYRSISQKERFPKYQYIQGVQDPSFYEKMYARGVEEADRQVGSIVEQLKKQGRYNDALIIVTADHGESFTERDLWFDHGTFPSEEQLHVPLLIKMPDQHQSGEQIGDLVALKDIMPTVLEILKIDAPSQVTGRSLLEVDGTFSKAGHAYLLGESSHCKKEIALQCAPIGPQGKVFSLRTPEQSMWLSAQEDQNLVWIFNSSQEMSAERFSAQKSSREQQSYLEILFSERSTRMDDLESIQWPQKKSSGKQSMKGNDVHKSDDQDITKDEELELLKQLGYIDSE